MKARNGLRLSGTILMVLIVIASAMYPAAASGNAAPDKNSESAESTIPHALGIWEQDLSRSREDGDTGHTISGAQFLPPCISGADKVIQIFAVIRAEEATDPVSIEAVVENPRDSFSRQVQLSPLLLSEGVSATGEAEKAGLIRHYTEESADDIITGIYEGTASVWKGEVVIPYGQNAGKYIVTVTGTDNRDNSSLTAMNSFMYIPVACMEFDFSRIYYGESRIDQETWVLGDDVFGTEEKPSVRNTGNCPARVRFIQDDMGLGRTADGAWNILYGVRIGDNTSISTYDPENEVVLSDPILPGRVESIDFSLYVYNGSGDHAGSMNLAFEMAECATDDDMMADLPAPFTDDIEESMQVPEFPGIRDILDLFAEFLDDNIFE